jgi:adenine-specific DNA glycosylase
MNVIVDGLHNPFRLLILYLCAVGAISSIAFENQVPLVDGNVIRVFSRLRAIGADPKNKQLNNLCWY